ncbi:MAG: AAA family ATPase [Marvinbryantia sp.]|uniref:AAA family ATPase n=1 Tax=Marvinbryantia sp. TaxID=2496532 RepID=UPI0025F69D61|nr:AAA family ATPase [uncultured Marvinbryantia sp.]
MAKVNLPYGIDLFEQLRSRNCYYVDKTGFIRELLSEEFTVNLIARPRRFGKTLTMSMLAEFFDIRKESRHKFEGLEIMKYADFCAEWMNQWPVLFLTLKDVQGRSFDSAYGMVQFVISSVCGEHDYLSDSDKVSEADKRVFHRLLEQSGTSTDVKTALFVLMRMMKAHYGKEVILLIDEYDVPLAKASDNGYYGEMLEVIRSLLGMTWKSNPNLKFAVVTGCLRIAKESIFTGANNFISNSISDKKYRDYFGFSEPEVTALLETAGLQDALTEMKKWYDGYCFGGKEIYCPWDVINHVRALMTDQTAKPGNYWIDTSHNNIIRRFIDHPQINVNEKFEILLSGGVIQEPIREDLTYDIAHSTEDNLWSILYLTGYLTQVPPGKLPKGIQPEDGKVALRIPNEEVKSVFGSTVKKWFEEKIAAQDRTALFEAWWGGDAEKLTQEITDILFDTISYFDYKEDYYHAMVTGMFLGAGYAVKSNSEAGTGRADVIIKEQRRRRALVIEVKWPGKKENGNSLEKECADALQQIEKKQYRKNLELEGYKTVLCYGAAFQGKTCLIKTAG